MSTSKIIQLPLSSLIRGAAAGLGAVLAGPTGALVGGCLGFVAGESTVKLVGRYVETFGENAVTKIFEMAGEFAGESITKRSRPLGEIQRIALLRAVDELGERPAFAENTRLFDLWKRALHAEMLSAPSWLADAVTARGFNAFHLFCSTMRSLAAEGESLKTRSLSLSVTDVEVPQSLLDTLFLEMPPIVMKHFDALILSDDNQSAWKEYDRGIQALLGDLLRRLSETAREVKQNTDLIPELNAKLDQILDQNEKLGIISRAQLSHFQGDRSLLELIAGISRAAASPKQRYGDIEFSILYEAGNIDDAIRVKSEQIGRGREQLSSDYIQLGDLYRLRFLWGRAQNAYKRAWSLCKSFDVGLKYADMLREQGHFQRALTIYNELLGDETVEPYRRAHLFVSLGITYRRLGQTQEAKAAYERVTEIVENGKHANPERYLPLLASASNNLGNLLADQGLHTDAIKKYKIAYAIYAHFLPDNLDAFAPKIITTLSCLALSCAESGEMVEAQEHFSMAVRSMEKLIAWGATQFRPELLNSLCLIAPFHEKAGEIDEAERRWLEAARLAFEIARQNPEAHLDRLANVLGNIFDFYTRHRRPETTFNYCSMAARELEAFYTSEPAWYGDLMSIVLMTRYIIEPSVANRREILQDAYDLANRTELKKSILQMQTALSQN